MLHIFVVALFESKGIAEDACNRLKTEGVPAHNITLLLLHETAAPASATMQPELEGLSVDPQVVGDVRRTYARFIRNGETAVFVRADSEADREFAIDTISLYEPIKIRVVSRGEGSIVGHDVL
jgi:hypothetical protein